MPQATRLREWRERRMLTMRELADLAKVGYVTIWRLENNKAMAEFRTIRKLAQALGIEPQELTTEEQAGAGQRKAA